LKENLEKSANATRNYWKKWKRNIDNFDGSSNKKKTDDRIRVAEMTLNKSEIEVLTDNTLEEAEKKGNLCKLIPSKFNAELLKKRKKPRAILRGIFHMALKAALLQQLARMKVKMVFISKNSNSGPIQKNLLIALQKQRNAKENFSHKGSLKKESYKLYKKNFPDITSGRVQRKKRKVIESIISREAIISRSHSSTQKVLTSLKKDQNAQNQNKSESIYISKPKGLHPKWHVQLLMSKQKMLVDQQAFK
ncbi:21991_t:CDS:2, partial [Gigaspora margarita]